MRVQVEYSIPGDPRPHIMLSPVMDPKVLDSWKRFQSLNLGDIGARAYELYQLGRTFEDRHHRRHHAVSHPAAELLGSGRSTSSQRAFLYDM